MGDVDKLKMSLPIFSSWIHVKCIPIDHLNADCCMFYFPINYNDIRSWISWLERSIKISISNSRIWTHWEAYIQNESWKVWALSEVADTTLTVICHYILKPWQLSWVFVTKIYESCYSRSKTTSRMTQGQRRKRNLGERLVTVAKSKNIADWSRQPFYFFYLVLIFCILIHIKLH